MVNIESEQYAKEQYQMAIKDMAKKLRQSTFDRKQKSEGYINALFKAMDNPKDQEITEQPFIHRQPTKDEVFLFFSNLGISPILKEDCNGSKPIDYPTPTTYGKVFGYLDTHICSCGHHKAYMYSSQMRAGDEGETTFFECEKCGIVLREN